MKKLLSVGLVVAMLVVGAPTTSIATISYICADKYVHAQKNDANVCSRSANFCLGSSPLGAADGCGIYALELYSYLHFSTTKINTAFAAGAQSATLRMQFHECVNERNWTHTWDATQYVHSVLMLEDYFGPWSGVTEENGTTFNCAEDTNCSNTSQNCVSTWSGGTSTASVITNWQPSDPVTNKCTDPDDNPWILDLDVLTDVKRWATCSECVGDLTNYGWRFSRADETVTKGTYALGEMSAIDAEYSPQSPCYPVLILDDGVATPTPTNTSTNLPTNTPTNTNTRTATRTPTATSTRTPTFTPTFTPTTTPTATPTATPTVTKTRTPTWTLLPTPAVSSTPAVLRRKQFDCPCACSNCPEEFNHKNSFINNQNTTPRPLWQCVTVTPSPT
jgi:hypothetical protein